MNKALLSPIIQALVTVFGQSDAFARVEAVVQRWEAKSLAEAEASPALTGIDKKAAVLAEMRVIGIEVAGWLAKWSVIYE